MIPILAATGDVPQQFLANPLAIFAVLGLVVGALWVAMLVAAYRRTR